MRMANFSFAMPVVQTDGKFHEIVDDM